MAVDGGIWANSPTMAALEEAVSVLKFPLERIDMLSLGTAGLSKIVNAPKITGEIGWAPGLADLFMNAQQEAALQQAETFLGSGHFVRIDEPAFEEMDDVGKLEELISRGGAVAEKHHRIVMERFVNGVKAADWRTV